MLSTPFVLLFRVSQDISFSFSPETFLFLVVTVAIVSLRTFFLTVPSGLLVITTFSASKMLGPHDLCLVILIIWFDSFSKDLFPAISLAFPGLFALKITC